LLVALIAILIISYAIWRSSDYTRGPSINVFWPQDGREATSSTIQIIGQAKRINQISLNGKQISIDEDGNFKETIIIFSGLNWITLHVNDRFGRDLTQQIRIVGK
jgi:hypothetical protein